MVPVLHSGHSEPLKGGVHAVACGLCVVMAGYSAAAFVERRKTLGEWHWHLLLNAAIYTVGTVWEAGHVRRHAAK